MTPAMKSILAGLVLLLSLTSNTLAQENGELGRMWTFEAPPLAYLEEEYGFKPDQEWLDSLRLGSLRLGGEVIGSASFVSPKGLILTSTRCVRRAVTATWPQDLEIINAGFVAATLKLEFRLRSRHDEWLTAAQLIKISDVTDEVNKGVLPTDNATRIKQKRDANKKTILNAAKKADPELVPEIVSLYQGAVVQLYQYKVYDDLRLVVLPHVQTAHFGGDWDNHTYPRHSLDFAFLRAYENGKPADTSKHYFKWKSGGAQKDELVFVSGNPNTTKRLATLAQLEFERDIRIPMRIEQLINSLRITTDRRGGAYRGDFDPENPSGHWSSIRTRILQSENSLKASRGNLDGLGDAQLMAQKVAAEQAFRDRVMADEQLARKYGDLWDRINSVVEQRRVHEARARFHTADGSPVLGVVLAIVRSLDPTETEEQRNLAREIADSWAGGTISPNFYFSARCLDHLVRSRNWLPADDPFFTKVLGGRTPEEFVDAMEGEQARRSPNWLGYVEPRKGLVNADWQAIRESEDPVVVAARELIVLMRQNKKLGDELDAKEEALGAEMARAWFECYGTKVSSDATGTLRFSDGVVKGYPSNGTIAPHRTTFYGLYARNAEFDNEYPFNLPNIWLDRMNRIDLTKTVNFVSANDISVGNSGSVVVNKELEVVGVVVDGNIETLHNDFVFRDDVSRTVSAHVDGIMEALVKIYDAHPIAKELVGK